VGADHDTARFDAQTIGRWWREIDRYESGIKVTDEELDAA